jgi:hypothetical protein
MNQTELKNFNNQALEMPANEQQKALESLSAEDFKALRVQTSLQTEAMLKEGEKLFKEIDETFFKKQSS